MQRLGIGSPLKIDLRKYYFRNRRRRVRKPVCDVTTVFVQHSVQESRNFLQPLEHPKIARVKISCALKGSYGFFPVPLTPLDETGKKEYLADHLAKVWRATSSSARAPS